MISEDFIPLLAPKPLSKFSPTEFKEYIKGLYFKKVPRKAAAKKKELKDLKVSAKVTKKGKISITTKRSPKYVTEEEFKEICHSLKRPENEIFISLKGSGFITLSHEEAASRRIKFKPSAAKSS